MEEEGGGGLEEGGDGLEEEDEMEAEVERRAGCEVSGGGDDQRWNEGGLGVEGCALEAEEALLHRVDHGEQEGRT